MEFIKNIKKIIYNNSNIKILNILKQFNIKIRYYDIGASGGLQPRANNFIEVLNPIFIEPDTSAFSQLEEKGYNAINCALWSEEKEKTFRITKSQWCSSIYEPNYEFLKKYKDPERFQIRLIPNQKANWDGMPWGEAWVEITEDGEISSDILNKRGEWRTNHLLDNIIPLKEHDISNVCMTYENDYLFFAMVSLNYNLQQKKNVYHYIFENAERNEFKGLVKNWREPNVKDHEKRLKDIYGI